MTGPDDIAGTPRTVRKSRTPVVAAVAVLALVLTAIVFYRWGSAGTPRPSPAAVISMCRRCSTIE
jgi:hypothetical protein